MGLYENIKSDQVKDLDCRDPVVVSPDQSIRSVTQAMRDGKLGCAILVDEAGKPRGLFTESKLTALLAHNPDSLDDPVQQHVDESWPQVKISDPIVSVLDSLVNFNTRFMIVVDEEGKLVKLTGQRGLMEYIADHSPGQVTVQRIGQKPYLHEREGA